MRPGLLLAVLVCASWQTSSAQTPLDLPAVLAIAQRNNPDLVTARLRLDSAYAEQRIARALPNPTATGIPNVPYQYSAAEPIDLGPQRIFRTRAAGQGASATRLDVEDVTRQVTFAVRQGYFDLLLAQALRDVAGDQRDTFRQLLVADSARVRTGDVPERNLATSEVQLARAEAALARAAAAVRAARLNLQALMGVANPDTGFAVQGALRYQPVAIPDSLAVIAAANRPDLAAANMRVEQDRSLASFATSQLIPTPTVNVTYQNGPPFTNGHQYQFGLGVTVPLFYWYGGERQRAKAAEQAADVETRKVRAQLASDVAQAVDLYQSSRVLAERYESGLLAKARGALETARYAYRAGAASQLDVLEAVRAYGDTRSDYYTAVHDYWVSVYALDRAVGKDLAP
jgi:cobalt-zinc-cadmium efflux system outer membrane protein